MGAGDKPDIAVSCANLSSTLAFYTDELGFRIDTIFPADAPRVAVLSGYDIDIRLESGGNSGEADDAWHTGRAGMQYRDLIPDRGGGRFIASHIRIPEGGPVPDYVHHHAILFQMIFCVNGWVRVAYEDQGPPIVMHAGDCVLQPPHIRHRVLECSDQMEVVEVACPAEHETSVDHELELPTLEHHPERDFGGQKFVFSEAKEASWSPWWVDGFEYRDTGIETATRGIASAVVARPAERSVSSAICHDAELLFLFVLNGSASGLVEGDARAVPAGEEFSLTDVSTDFEMLAVTLSADQSER